MNTTTCQRGRRSQRYTVKELFNVFRLEKKQEVEIKSNRER